MNRYLASYDLHLHSCWSYDAAVRPEEYFQMAREHHLRAFAITDHHNFCVIPEMVKLAPKYPDVHWIPGAELTSHTPFGNMDFVCLGLPLVPTPAMAQLQAELFEYQHKIALAFQTTAEALGGTYTAEERKKLLLSYRPEEVVEFFGDTHVRNELQMSYLIKKGVMKDMDEWNRKWRELRCCPDPPDADRVSRIVHEAGGIILIAHPSGYFCGMNEKRMDAIREFADLDGIECAHPSTPPENGTFYRKYCEKHHLLSSAGTDLHFYPGRELPEVPEYHTFAEHVGRDRWLDELLERVTLQ